MQLEINIAIIIITFGQKQQVFFSNPEFVKKKFNIPDVYNITSKAKKPVDVKILINYVLNKIQSNKKHCKSDCEIIKKEEAQYKRVTQRT